MLNKKRIALIYVCAMACTISSVRVLAEEGKSSVLEGEWRNPALSVDRRSELLLAQLTQEEKLRLVLGFFGSDQPEKGFKKHPQALRSSAGYIEGVPRLGIPALFETDAGVGVATQGSGKANPRERTSLPSGLATAATWNKRLAFEGGAMIGAEARASGFNVMLAGGTNLLREPRNGRNFEYGGEDPLLAGTIVAQQIKGIESNNIISTMKHFAMNDQETGRFVVDAHIDDASAHMSDLLAMQFVIEQANPGSVMCSYNRVNGVYACESDYLLNEILKKEWGYKGFVMSDWGAVHSTVAAANNGLDQESGWEFDVAPYFGGSLKEAVENGAVPQSRLDDMVKRILRTMYAKGVMDHPVAEGGAIDFPAHALVTRSDAEEAIVLLKNDKKLLPLGSDLRKIAVIGAHSDVGVITGGGSSQVYALGGNAVPGAEPTSWPGPVQYFPSSPLRHIRTLATRAEVTYDDGRDPKAAAQLAASADVVIVFATQWLAESRDALNLSLPNAQDELISAVAAANPATVVVLETGGPVTMPWANQVGAIVEAWYPGTSGGDAIARILFGKVNPSGHLPVTFPAAESQLPRPVLDGDRNHEDRRFSVNYFEGAAVGYKWFDVNNLKPLFPFGHGLSYTQFSYSNLAGEFKDGRLRAHFTVTNSGKLGGKDVPQVYVQAMDGHWEAPRRLAGWDKVELAAGQSKQVDVEVDPRLLATFDSKAKVWRIKAGALKIVLAANADLAKVTGKDGANAIVVNLPAQTLNARGENAK
ncbi:MAG TPA: glycoside hydrolase family 3 C-terminal domain-containing protein [Burkholderiaceae bacterium]